MHEFYLLGWEKFILVCCQLVPDRLTNYDASCIITSLAINFTRLRACKVLDKLSRAAFAKHTSFNWRNGETTYLVLLTMYCSFNIHMNIFHCKTHFVWYEISISFYSHNIYYNGFIGKDSFKLKFLLNFLNWI